MAHRKTLNELQLQVLRWVAEGCPDSVMEGVGHRITAAALERRGLVSVSGRGETWTCAVTDSGREYMRGAAKPEAVLPRQGNVSVTEQLVAEIMEAGGSLVLPRLRHGSSGVDYEQRAKAAVRYGKVPPRKRLLVTYLDFKELRLDLIDVSVGADSPDVSAPGRVNRYHPVVQKFRQSSAEHRIARRSMPRVCRLLHALVVEAETRGHKVDNGGVPNKAARKTSKGSVVVKASGFSWVVVVSEEGVPALSSWVQQNGKYTAGFGWGRVPPRSEYEVGATGRLTLEVISQRGPSRIWSDRKRWRLEEKLSEVVGHIEGEAAEDQFRQQEEERKEQQRHREWETAMKRAVERYNGQRRIDELTRQIQQWRTAREILSYCDVVDRTYPGNSEVGAWLTWTRAYAASIDPLRTPPHAPAWKEPNSPADLRPFLDGWGSLRSPIRSRTKVVKSVIAS